MSTEAFDIGDSVQVRGGHHGEGVVMGKTFDGLLYVLFLYGSVCVPAEKLEMVRSAGN